VRGYRGRPVAEKFPISGASDRAALTLASVCQGKRLCDRADNERDLCAAARQTAHCCLEPFGCLPVSAVPGEVHSGVAPRIGSTIVVFREDEGAQQNALVMTLPMRATSAKQANKLRYSRKFTIAEHKRSLKDRSKRRPLWREVLPGGTLADGSVATFLRGPGNFGATLRIWTSAELNSR